MAQTKTISLQQPRHTMSKSTSLSPTPALEEETGAYKNSNPQNQTSFKDPNTCTQAPLPFILRAFGYKVPHPPLVLNPNKPFPNPSHQQARRPRADERYDYKLLTLNPRTSAPSPASAREEFELPELTDGEVKAGLKRILLGAYPWEEVDALVKYGHEHGVIDDDERWEWDMLYGFQLDSFPRLVEEADCNFAISGVEVPLDIPTRALLDTRLEIGRKRARETLNDLLVWMVACDQVWGVGRGVGDVLRGFGVDELTVAYEWCRVRIGIGRWRIED